MSFETELKALQERHQKLQIKQSAVKARLDEKLQQRNKIIQQLKEKNIDPKNLPSIIEKLELEIQNKMDSFEGELNSFERELSDIEDKLNS